jgi:preprotein translocase subunit YajC
LEILSTLIMFGAMFGIMYFLLIRPQKKQQQKVQDMLSNLEVGDSIVTIGGLHGIIDEINDAAKTVVLDCEGIYLTFERRAVARVVTKATDTVTTAEPEDLGTNEPDVDEDITEE